MYKKASSTLLEINKNVFLKFHVQLFTKAKDGVTELPDSFYSVYTNTMGEYITYQVKSFVSLELKDDRPWNKSRSITITPNNIVEVMNGVNLAIGLIYERETFFYNSDGELRVNYEHIKKAKAPNNAIQDGIIKKELGYDQFLEIVPSAIYDNFEDTFYEGALISLNNSTNTFPIILPKLEALKYTLEKIDFTVYTGTILNMYFHTLYDKDNRLKAENAPPRVNVFNQIKNDEDPKMIEQNNITGPSVNKSEVTANSLLDI